MIIRRAFTFLELIVSVSLIMLLVALLLPVMAHSRESARRSACQSNLTQVVTAAHLYAQDHNGRFPANPDGLVWVQILQPYLKNYGVMGCPSEPSESRSRYSSGNWGVSYRYAGGYGNDDPGETSLAWDWGPWHDGGLNVVCIDGHVRWLRDGAPYSEGRERRPVSTNGGGE